MTKHQFISGIGIGVLAGATLGLAMSTSKKREIKRAADKAIKAVGEVVDNISENMGM
jgi:predicted small secreted protein